MLNDPEKYETPFAELCAKADISGIKGHRSVGGYRASIYNAMTKEKDSGTYRCNAKTGKIMKKKKILANDGMSKAGVEILENAGFEVITQNRSTRRSG